MNKPSRQRTFAGFEPDLPPGLAEAQDTAAAGSPAAAQATAPREDTCHAPPPLPPAGQRTAADIGSLDQKSVYVVDAHSLIYQVFHAMPEMSSPTGEPVGAIHGFIRDVLDLIEKKQPDFLFCAFDAPGGETFRHELFTSYKANREEMPADLRPQIAHIQRMLAALGVPVLICPNYEADDILATLAHHTEARGGNCVLVTGDKDCRQLISDHVSVYNIRKDEMCGQAQLDAEWGVRPEQVVDFQALVGDSVDNVPGVPLIGPKNAKELLQRFGTLENLFEHVDELPAGKRRDNLRAYRDQALLSRQLVRLDRATPIDWDWNAGRVGQIDRLASLELCREFGFRRLAERISAMSVVEAPATWQAHYETVTSLDQLRELVGTMQRQQRISFDTETTHVSPRQAELVGISFAWQEGRAYYVPIRAPRGEVQLAEADVLEVLRPLLENPAVQKIGQNMKYDIIVLRNTGITVQGMAFDTMVADYLLEPGERIHNLDDLAQRFLDHGTIKIEDLIGTGRQQKRMDEVPVALITDYAAEDADVPLRLTRILERRLDDEGLLPLFRDLEMPLVEVLAEMEFNGIQIDVDRLAELSQRFGQRLLTLESEIYALAGRSFNIDSPRQLAQLLFEQLKLPVLKRTKTGPSTDVDVLNDLAKLHELPARIIEYRQHAKLKGTYVDALPRLVCSRTGRIHT
ncbi:MAG: DNA polymerase, partial [Pirellulaceae bacterium]